MKKLKTVLLIVFNFILIFTLVTAQDIGDEFKERNGEEWIVGSYPWDYINLGTRYRPEYLGPDITSQEAINITEDFMNLNKDLFGLDSFSIYDVKTMGVGEHQSWVTYLIGDVYEGLPITKIDMRALMTMDGNIFGVGDVEVCSDVFSEILRGQYRMPEVSEDEAIQSAQDSVGSDKEPIKTGLEYVPENQTNEFKYTLGWNVEFDDKKVLVDATDGEVLSIETFEKEYDFAFLKNPIIYVVIIVTILFVLILRSLKKRKRRLKFRKIKKFNI